MANQMQRKLLGFAIDAATLTEAVARCTDAVDQHEQLCVGVVNSAKIVGMRRDTRLREAVDNCGMVLADGQAVVWASRLLGAPLPERVAGIDLFMALLTEADRQSYRVYFLGARPDVLSRMLDEVAERFPRAKVVGARNGYYEPGTEAQVASEIRNCDPDILFVGMSSPKKELFLREWGTDTRARVLHGVGGSFDILAGLTRRAPLWYQEHGLEWLYRVWQEPKRLGRRYLTTNAAFIAIVIREYIRRRARLGQAPDTSNTTELSRPVETEISRKSM
jgi:N-acetylglucosaminyldiphosphoundecaprenol N-acetyl-beta-D-mannosaminyltransferase